MSNVSNEVNVDKFFNYLEEFIIKWFCFAGVIYGLSDYSIKNNVTSPGSYITIGLFVLSSSFIVMFYFFKNKENVIRRIVFQFITFVFK